MPLPTPLPILDARGRYLRAGLSFSRASAKRVFDARGTLVTVAANVPAWDCDPLTGAERGLLIEEARTNLLTCSEQFDNTAYGSSGVSISANAVTAPDGATTADAITETAVADVHRVTQSVSKTTSSIQYTVSMFVKPNGRTHAILAMSGAAPSNRAQALFTLSGGGTAATPTLSGTGWSGASSGIVSAGNGWYRIWLTATSDTSASVIARIQASDGTAADAFDSYPGDTAKGLYVWGAQLEAGGFPTSYIPTTGSPATRLADSATLSLPNAPWWSAAGFTVVAEASRSSTSGSAGWIWQIDDGTTSNRAFVVLETEPLQMDPYVTADGVAQLSGLFSPADWAVGTAEKIALAVTANSAAAARGGALTGSDDTVTMPTGLTTLRVGSNEGASRLNGHIRRLVYYPRRIANADLLAMTA